MQFGKNVYYGEKASLTTGSKAGRASARLGLIGMGASFVCPPLGLALIGTSSAIQFGEGVNDYRHGNKQQGRSEMAWGPIMIL